MLSDGPRPTTIALLQSNSLPMLVQKEIERLILAGDLAAGEKLNENTLALRLGVSRGPVREAFRALEAAGLVRLEKNRGVFVCALSAEEASEIYDLRAALVELAGRKLAVTITAEQLNQLRALVDRMDRAAAGKNIEAYYPLNLQFHDHLLKFTGNRKLAVTYRQLSNELHLFRKRSLVYGDGLLASNNEHRLIVDKIAAGDPAAAGKAMYDHILAGRQRMLQGDMEIRRLGPKY